MKGGTDVLGTRRKKHGMSAATAGKENVFAGASRAAARVIAAHDKGIGGGGRASRRPALADAASRSVTGVRKGPVKGEAATRKLRLG